MSTQIPEPMVVPWRAIALLLATIVWPLAAAETVSVTVPDATATEPGIDGGVITIQRAVATTSPLVVNLTRSGTATAGVDYVAIPATITIPANATAVQIPVQPLDDATAEVPETVIVTVATGTGYTVGSPASGTVTIVDDEPVRVTVTASDASAAEAGVNTGAFTLARTGALDLPLTVFAAVGGTATAGSDYAPIPTAITIPAGAATVVVTVTPIDDAVAEPDETVTLTLSAGAYVIGTTTAVTVTIADNEPVTLVLAATDATASEPGTDTGIIQVQRRGLKSSAVTATYTVSGTATPGTDYVALSGTVTLAANATTANITITPLADTIPEGDETVAVALAPGSAYVLDAPATQTVTIRDDEWLVTVVATDPIASEPTGDTGVFTIARTGAGSTAAALVVPYTVSGTAMAGSDYTALSGTATIAAGATSTTVTVTPINDTTAESVETVTLVLTPSSTYRTGDAATVSIVDNDTPIATVTLATTDNAASETGTNGGLFTVTRSGLLTGALPVAYTVTGTALNGIDYQTLSGVVTIPDQVASALIPVTVMDDALTEVPETVIVTLAPQTSYLLGSTKTGTVTIADNDAQVVTIAATDNAAGEPGSGKGNGTFTLTRQGDVTTALTITVVIGGTAQPGSDYTALPTTATFAANAATKTITVVPLDDTVPELAETVIVSVVPGSGYTVGSAASATVTMWDDETPEVTIAATDAVAVESPANTGQWTVTRRGKLTAALTVPLTVSGTATSGSDYTALATSVTIAANAATATLTVTPLNDALVEGDETVTETIASGAGFTIGSPSSATVVITDDEPAVSITAVDGTATVVGDVGLLQVTRSGSLTNALTINLAYAGTALADGDYTALPATVTIPASQSGTMLVVNPLARTGQPAACTVIGSIQPGSGYGIAGVPATVTIRTDLPPSVVVKAQPLNPSTPTAITLDAGSSSDPNGDALTHYWYNYGLGISVNGPVFTGNLSTPGLTSIMLVVSDGRNQVTRSIPLTLITTTTTIAAADATGDDGVLIVSGATVSIDGFHRYLAGRIVNSGVVKPAAVLVGEAPKALDIAFTDDLTVASGSMVDASGMGYARGYTVGNTQVGGATGRAGGSHGGYGGDSMYSIEAISTGIANEVYDDFMNPLQPGGGGGMGVDSPAATSFGGGVIKIVAGSLTNNGAICANGQGSTPRYVGCGAGGSVNLQISGAYGGTGALQANGGAVGYGYEGGGGGGRIALICGSGTVNTILFQAKGEHRAGCGTIYVSRQIDAYPTLRLAFAAQGYEYPHRATPLWFGVRSDATDDPVSWSADVQLDQNAWLTTEGRPVEIYARGPAWGPSRQWITSVRCDALTMTGAKLTAVNVTGGSLTMTSNSNLSPVDPDATGPKALTLTLTGALSIDATSTIDANAKGFARGYTVGNTQVGGATGRAGGSHGGYGGDSIYAIDAISNGITNEVYDDFMNPLQSGGGGGMGLDSPATTSFGGGVIKIVAGSLTNNGVICANGQGSTPRYVGCGAGGSVNLRVSGAYGGTGSVQANGGVVAYGNEGGGGGGRIALICGSGTVNTTLFQAKGEHRAGCGTIYILRQIDAYPTLRLAFAAQGYDYSHRATPLWFGVRSDASDDPVSWSADVQLDQNARWTTEGRPVEIYARGPAWGPSQQWITSVRCDALTMTGAKLTAMNMTGVSLTMTNNSNLSLVDPDATGPKALTLTLTGALSIDATSMIDANAKGFARGYTVGNTQVGGATGRAGGSHGGYGGDSIYAIDAISNGIANEVYDDFMNPLQSGGGGGMGLDSPAATSFGGGVIKIVAGSLTNNGVICANGQGSTPRYVGCGAGGSVNLRVSGAYGGTGSVQANGGVVAYGNEGGGGGGRIALICGSGTVNTTLFQAKGEHRAGCGTIYILRQIDAYPTLRLAFAAQGYDYSHRATPLWFGVRSDASDDPVSWSADVQLDQNARWTTEGRPVEIYARGPAWGPSRQWITSVRCDALAMTGAKLTAVNLAGTSLTMTNNSNLSPVDPDATGPKALTLTLTGALSIDATSTIDANAKGFARGYTVGNTQVGGATGRAGGSHGGYGGDVVGSTGTVTPAQANVVYGNLVDPIHAGAGGGFGVDSPALPSNGGGIVRVLAGSIVNNGLISSNGMDSAGRYVGCGAGGSVSIFSGGSYTGSGQILANGGNPGTGSEGGGGGGRIAVHYGAGTVSVNQMSVAGNGYAGPGTIYLRDTRVSYGTAYFSQRLCLAAPVTPLFFGVGPNDSLLTQPKCPEDMVIVDLPGASHVLAGDTCAFDADDDGMPSWEEIAAGTNPRMADENFDGMNDKASLAAGIDPHNMDQDGDGVVNALEQARGTNPFSADTDGDGVNDAADVAPLDASLASWPSPSPTDVAPPVITIDEPASAVLIP